jgi:hypothetical protein
MCTEVHIEVRNFSPNHGVDQHLVHKCILNRHFERADQRREERARMTQKVQIDIFTPGRACPCCQAEGAQPQRHERPVLIVFGGGPQWPCSGMDATTGEHMCTRCGSCGYAWMETLPQGMDAAMPP